MKKIWQTILRAWTKWRLKRITHSFHKAWELADERMKAAGMRRYERRQYRKDLIAGRVSDLKKLLEIV